MVARGLINLDTSSGRLWTLRWSGPSESAKEVEFVGKVHGATFVVSRDTEDTPMVASL